MLQLPPSHMLSPNGAGQLEPASWSGFGPVYWSGLPGPGVHLEWFGPAARWSCFAPLPPLPPPPSPSQGKESARSPGKKRFLFSA
jgi:hypothetical protein